MPLITFTNPDYKDKTVYAVAGSFTETVLKIAKTNKIPINFYKKVKLETERKRKKFVEQGGAIEDFQPAPDPLEEKIKDLFRKFRDMKSDFNKNLELEKQDNLRRKYDVIEKIKELILPSTARTSAPYRFARPLVSMARPLFDWSYIGT